MVKSLSQIGAWRSLVARLLWEQEVGGSNPLAPTNIFIPNQAVRRLGDGRFALEYDQCGTCAGLLPADPISGLNQVC